jgi:mono/diheme cytochrome c family protein
MKTLHLAAITMIALSIANPAPADDAAVRGEKVVDQWCRLCHLRAGDPPNPDMAPPYEEIVRRAGRDEAYFIRFLEEDHFPMTIYRLFDDEKRDVVAYLLSLKSDDRRAP